MLSLGNLEGAFSNLLKFCEDIKSRKEIADLLFNRHQGTPSKRSEIRTRIDLVDLPITFLTCMEYEELSEHWISFSLNL
jgi:hypothetical protein